MAKKSKKQQALLEEYATLRTEVLARHGLRNQILLFTITGLGIVLSLPLANQELYKIALFFPVLAAFLAVGWSQHDIRIGEIGEFIALKIEPKVPRLTWEGHLRKERVAAAPRTILKPIVRTSELYALGIFVGSQVLAIVSSIPSIVWSTNTYIILALDVVAIIISLRAVTKRASLYPN